MASIILVHRLHRTPSSASNKLNSGHGLAWVKLATQTDNVTYWGQT